MVGMPLVDIFLIRTLVENVGTSDEGLEGADDQAADCEDTETRTRMAKENVDVNISSRLSVLSV